MNKKFSKDKQRTKRNHNQNNKRKKNKKRRDDYSSDSSDSSPSSSESSSTYSDPSSSDFSSETEQATSDSSQFCLSEDLNNLKDYTHFSNQHYHKAWQSTNQYQISLSDHTSLIHSLKSNQRFRDKKFIKNLPEEVDEDYPYCELVYKNSSEIFGEKNYLVFNGIAPSRVIQQDLGDCYLLNAVSCLASRPHLLTSLFETTKPNKTGAYVVWLNINGRPTRIVVEDSFPVMDRGFGLEIVFSTPSIKQNYLWTMIIEKAYAKAYGGYHKIDIGGNSDETFRDLCQGAPAESLDFEDYFEEKKHVIGKGWQKVVKEIIWKKLKNAFNGGYLVTLETVDGEMDPETKEEILLDKGMEGDHAYSLLAVKVIRVDAGENQDQEIEKKNSKKNRKNSKRRKNKKKAKIVNQSKFDKKTNTKKIRLLKIRNPYGEDEFEGDWSRHSEKWTPSALQQLSKHPKEEQRGVFWMGWEDFFEYFASINVSHVQTNAKYAWKDVKFKLGSTKFRAFAKIKVPCAGTYAFSIDQQDDHSFPARTEADLKKRTKKLRKKFKEEDKKLEEDSIFEYNMASLTVGRVDEDKIKFVGYNECNVRNLFIEKYLRPGEYVVLVDILADENNIRLEKKNRFSGKFRFWRDVVLSAYGPGLCGIKVFDEKSSEVDEFIGRPLSHFDYFFQKTWQDFTSDAYRTVKYVKMMYEFGKYNKKKHNQHFKLPRGEKISYSLMVYKFYYMDLFEMKNKSDKVIEINYHFSSKNVEFLVPQKLKKYKNNKGTNYEFSLRLNPGEVAVYLSRLIDEDKDEDVFRKKPKVRILKNPVTNRDGDDKRYIWFRSLKFGQNEDNEAKITPGEAVGSDFLISEDFLTIKNTTQNEAQKSQNQANNQPQDKAEGPGGAPKYTSDLNTLQQEIVQELNGLEELDLDIGGISDTHKRFFKKLEHYLNTKAALKGRSDQEKKEDEKKEKEDKLWHKKRKIKQFYAAFVQHIVEKVNLPDLVLKLKTGREEKQWDQKLELVSQDLDLPEGDLDKLKRLYFAAGEAELRASAFNFDTVVRGALKSGEEAQPTENGMEGVVGPGEGDTGDSKADDWTPEGFFTTTIFRDAQ